MSAGFVSNSPSTTRSFHHSDNNRRCFCSMGVWSWRELDGMDQCPWLISSFSAWDVRSDKREAAETLLLLLSQNNYFKKELTLWDSKKKKEDALASNKTALWRLFSYRFSGKSSAVWGSSQGMTVILRGELMLIKHTWTPSTKASK